MVSKFSTVLLLALIALLATSTNAAEVSTVNNSMPLNPNDPDYKIAPILNMFADEEGTGTYDAAVLKCREGGAYLASDPTEQIHDAHVQVMQDFMGDSKNWFAFLGTTSRTPDSIQFSEDNSKNICQYSIISLMQTNITAELAKWGQGASFNFCFYRWNLGRWLEIEDYLFYNVQRYPKYWYYRGGVSFYYFRTNYAITDQYARGPLRELPSYFPFSEKSATSIYYGTLFDINDRPGNEYGNFIVMVGKNGGTWSDNEPQGGYTYAYVEQTPTEKDYNSTDYRSRLPACFTRSLNSGLSEPTIPQFKALCDAQAGSRTMLEPYNDPQSKSKLLWYVIFLVVLFVVCLIIFIIIAVCQEREDMDEPPEDAPQWAQDEANQVQQPKRYVSQKSFREVPNEDLDDSMEMESFEQ